MMVRRNVDAVVDPARDGAACLAKADECSQPRSMKADLAAPNHVRSGHTSYPTERSQYDNHSAVPASANRLIGLT